MNIAFRTDATSQMGTGHFMRCLTLADALQQQGARIRFVSRGLPDHLRDMLTAKDMQFVPLGGRSFSIPYTQYCDIGDYRRFHGSNRN